MSFHAYSDPSAELLANAEESAPANPFFTAAYARARAEMGETAWLFHSELEGRETFCPAFLRSGRLTRTLEIPSFPAAEEIDAFTRGLYDTCRRKGVAELWINTFASPALRLPSIPGEVERLTRSEFTIDLRAADLMKTIGRTHRQRIRQAERAGVEISRTRDPAAARSHVELIGASMHRRFERGENLTFSAESSVAEALLRHGSAELFQAVLGGEVVSSLLVLRSRLGGYDHSSGTSPAGMSLGASHFLIFSAASALQKDGFEGLNLGGVRESEAGLRSFKSYFGAEETALESAFCRPAHRIRSKLIGMAQRLAGGARRQA